MMRNGVDVVAAMGKAHRVLQPEAWSFEPLDREGEQSLVCEGAPTSREDRREIAEVAKRVGGEDEFEGPGRATAQESRRFGDRERVIEAARLRDHRRREIDADEAVDPRPHRLAHETGAATDVQRRGEPSSRRGRLERLGNQGGAAIAELLGEVLVETGRVVVEQTGHIGCWQGVEALFAAQEREARSSAYRVGRIDLKRTAVSARGAIAIVEVFARLRQREPGRRPAGSSLQRLLKQLCCGGKIFVVRRRPAVGVAALGDEIVRRRAGFSTSSWKGLFLLHAAVARSRDPTCLPNASLRPSLLSSLHQEAPGLKFALALGFCMAASASAAEASIQWRWTCEGEGFGAQGAFTTGDAPNAEGYYEITAITGEAGGVAITGLQPAGTAIPGNEGYPVDNLVREAAPELSKDGIGFSLADGRYVTPFYGAHFSPPGFYAFITHPSRPSREPQVKFTAVPVR